MNYQESKDYLYNLGHELSVKKFGLQNTATLLKALGQPHERFFKVQVAGTNGKGSTSAFLSAIATNAGIKTGLFTSPHLIEPTERTRINEEVISEDLFAKHATIIKEVSEKLVQSGELRALPTFFEQITAISLNIFAEQEVDLAILEVGLGGRFDATTATGPEIAVITPIDIDHTNILGDTIQQIAAEKAEIIRKDSKAVFITTQQPQEAKIVLDQKCISVSRTPKFVDTDPQIGPLSLLGEHQKTNASLAAAVAQNLNQFGFPISDSQIQYGLSHAHHSGRLEYIDGILFDGAHNKSGVEVLVKYLKAEIKKPIVLIFGAMKDKDISEMTKSLLPLARQVILTQTKQARAMPAAEITQQIPEEAGEQFMYITNSVEEALTKAKSISGDNQIVVAGSLYLVGEAQKIIKEKTA